MFRIMFKSARAIIALGLIGGVSLAVIVGWVTGFFASIASTVADLGTTSGAGSTRRWGGSTSSPGLACSSSRSSCSC